MRFATDADRRRPTGKDSFGASRTVGAPAAKRRTLKQTAVPGMPDSVASMRRSKAERDRFRHMLVDVVIRQDCGLKRVEQVGKDGGRNVDRGGRTASPMAAGRAAATPATSAAAAPRRPDEPLTAGEKDELRQVDR